MYTPTISQATWYRKKMKTVKAQKSMITSTVSLLFCRAKPNAAIRLTTKKMASLLY